MITIGRSIRWYNDFYREAAFSKENGFDFMQVWFKDGKLLIDSLPEPREKHLKACGFPVIIHAVFDPADFDAYGGRLLDLAAYLGHQEVIVHPVCKKEPITPETGRRLAKKVRAFSADAQKSGITFYLENNSVIDGFHYKPEELAIVFEQDAYVQQLLDVAHIDNYHHLAKIISVRFPKCLHVAGKHFAVPHEHLPLTEGDIDYGLVFQKYLPGYDGRVILEVDGTDEEIIASKKIIEKALPSAGPGRLA